MTYNLGRFVRRKSHRPDTRICANCGEEAHEGFVYRDGVAFYCCEDCLFEYFTEEEIDQLIEMTELGEDPCALYYVDLTGRK